MKKEGKNLKENQEGYMGAFGGRKGKGDILQLYHNLANEECLIY